MTLLFISLHLAIHPHRRLDKKCLAHGVVTHMGGSCRRPDMIIDLDSG